MDVEDFLGLLLMILGAGVVIGAFALVAKALWVGFLFAWGLF
jgi:hypothetical protein